VLALPLTSEIFQLDILHTIHAYVHFTPALFLAPCSGKKIQPRGYSGSAKHSTSSRHGYTPSTFGYSPLSL
jgi:hypothetical protein